MQVLTHQSLLSLAEFSNQIWRFLFGVCVGFLGWGMVWVLSACGWMVGGGVGWLENKVPGRVQQVLTLCPFDPVGASISIWFVGTRLCALGWEDRDLLTSSAFKLLGGVLWSFQGSVSSPEAVLSLFQVLC